MTGHTIGVLHASEEKYRDKQMSLHVQHLYHLY